MPLFGSDTNKDGESLLADLRDGRWRAKGVERTDLVAEAADLDALRAAVIAAARARRGDEGLAGRTWKVAYLWGVDIAPRPSGLFRSLGSMFRSGPRGPVLEVTPTGVGYVGRAEDGSTISATTLAELNERARQRHAPLGSQTEVESITLFEVLEIPPEADADGGR